MKLWKWFRKKTADPDEGWYDIQDPRGDGTLRPGDALYDAMLSGNPVMGSWKDGKWEIEELKDEE